MVRAKTAGSTAAKPKSPKAKKSPSKKKAGVGKFNMYIFK